MTNARLIISLGLVLIIVLFIIQNTAVMEFRFFIWTLAMSRALMLFFVLGIGILCGWFLRGYFVSGKKR
jgi:uncharacterized integral membrane protein